MASNPASDLQSSPARHRTAKLKRLVVLCRNGKGIHPARRPLSKSSKNESFGLIHVFQCVLSLHISDFHKWGNHMARIGYARVSSSAQDYQGQIEALNVAGCLKIYSEKISGKTTDGRKEFNRLMRDLLPGDVVVVTKLDRLARSSRDLHNIVHELETRSCGFVSLGESWCDTTTEVGKLMLTIMGGIAEFERSLIQKRCEEGIARAKRKGVTFGRKRKLDQEMVRVAAARYAKGETMAALAREYEVSEPTIWRALQPDQAQAA
jgi:DNA invertase Pin-like site-specific DNA recombinase